MTRTDAPPHHDTTDEPLRQRVDCGGITSSTRTATTTGTTNPNSSDAPSGDLLGMASRRDDGTTAASWLLDFCSSSSSSATQQQWVTPERIPTPPAASTASYYGEDTTTRTTRPSSSSTAASTTAAAAAAATTPTHQRQPDHNSNHNSSESKEEVAVSLNQSPRETIQHSPCSKVSSSMQSSMPPPPPPAAAMPRQHSPQAQAVPTTGRRSRFRHEISSTNYSTATSKNSSSGTAEACLVHCPTLEELQKTTFSNYVRHTVLAAAAAAAVGGHPEVALRDDSHYCKFIRDDDDHDAPPLSLKQGMARVRLPLRGLWQAPPPYRDDRTGRGPLWQRGSLLGDWILSSPMQQNIRGMAGVYEYTPTDLPSCTLAEFRTRADDYHRQQMGRVRLNGDDNDGNEEEEDGDSTERKGKTKGARPETTEKKNRTKSGPRKTDTASTTKGPTLDNTQGNNNHNDDEDLDPHHRPGDWSRAQVAELERQFWKRLSPTMPPAVYGADEAGTLFGDDPASGWSLAQLDSCLHVLSSDIPGVTSPYLYAGMWASVFCAHAEDMNLLSINYLHAGQPKVWYAIAQRDAARFLSLAEHHYSHQYKQCKEFLRHKRCLLSPAILKKAGIRYQTTVQYPGDAIITFPGGFHFGFNAGFNLAEATNFGVPEWIPFGRMARVCLCRPDSVRIDMDRFVTLLRRYQRDRQRNKRLTWKSWQEREERKNYSKHIVTGIVEETEDTIVEVISCARKKRKTSLKKQSEQQRKNEFWIEVVKPSSGSPSKKPSPRKNAAAAAATTTTIVANRWHLAKPIGRSRKRLEVNTAVLCLVPTVPPVRRRRRQKHQRRARNGTDHKNDNNDDGNSSSSSLNEFLSSDDEPVHDDDEHEECFAGTIVEVSEGFVRIHLGGLPKSQDLWMLQDSPKLFLDGGVWEETDAANHPPQHHYWKEMDSKKRLCA